MLMLLIYLFVIPGRHRQGHTCTSKQSSKDERVFRNAVKSAWKNGSGLGSEVSRAKVES